MRMRLLSEVDRLSTNNWLSTRQEARYFIIKGRCEKRMTGATNGGHIIKDEDLTCKEYLSLLVIAKDGLEKELKSFQASRNKYGRAYLTISNYNTSPDAIFRFLGTKNFQNYGQGVEEIHHVDLPNVISNIGRIEGLLEFINIETQKLLAKPELETDVAQEIQPQTVTLVCA